MPQIREETTQERHGHLMKALQLTAPLTSPMMAIRAAFLRHANGVDVYDVCDILRAYSDTKGGGWDVIIPKEEPILDILGFDSMGVPRAIDSRLPWCVGL